MATTYYVYYHYYYLSQYDETERHGYVQDAVFSTEAEARDYIEKRDSDIDHNRSWYSIETQPLPSTPTAFDEEN